MDDVRKKGQSPSRGAWRLRDVIVVLAWAAIAGLFLRLFVLDACVVRSSSMESTLLPGDFLLIDKLAYGPRTPDELPFLRIPLPAVRLPALTAPRRGDVIVFNAPAGSGDTGPSVRYVKRIVAVPGDTVTMRGGSVSINGVPAPTERIPAEQSDTVEEWRIVLPRKGDRVNALHGVTVTSESDCYFVLGDNRQSSVDSRSIGPISSDEILGKALMIFWSIDPSSGDTRGRVRWHRLGTRVR